MTTARQIIKTAYRRLGVIATNEEPNAAEAQDALDTLNDMLDTWSLENLLVLGETITTQVLTPLKQSYTIGTGGDIAITWPTQIDQAQLRVTSVTPNLDLPLRILNDQEYAQIRLKTQQSTYVQAIYFNATYPLGTMFVWPVPTQAETLVLWTKDVVASFATLDTNVTLGRGYPRALRYNLALELAAEHGRLIPPEVERLARDSRAVLKRSNTTPELAMLDLPAGQRSDYGAYNWRDDRGV